MQFVKHHVFNSGNTTIRGYFGSESTEFDPPSDSLRQNIKKEKAKIIYDLAAGATGDPEEDEIRDRIVASENSYEIIRMFGAIDGWAELDNELPEGHLDPIARQLAQVLDQRDYVVYQLIRRYMALLDYNASPNLGDCLMKLLTLPVQYQPPEIDRLLTFKEPLLKGIASATLRQRTNMENAARIHPDVIWHYINVAPHKVNELVSLMHQVNYTTLICHSLAELDIHPLYGVITDMVNPALMENPPGVVNVAETTRKRIACKDACIRLQLAFAAARDAVDVAGSTSAKTTINRFMLALKITLDNFPATVPNPGLIGQIAAALQDVATTVAELQQAITDLPDALAGLLTLGEFLGTSPDDKARTLISKLEAQNSLAHVSYDVKLQMLNALLDGSTDDDDEIAINKILKTAKAHDQAECYQLAAAATWESLYTSVNGDEYDEMESILNMPA